MSQLPATSAATPARIREVERQLPHGLTVVHRGEDLVLRRSLRHGSLTAFFVVFTAVWDLVLGITLVGGGGWMPALTHGIPALWLTWYTLVRLFNTQVIEVARGRVRVDSGPLPTTDRKSLVLDNVEGLGTRTSNVRINGRPTWEVVVHLRDGKVRKLVGGFQDQETARALESVMAEHLGMDPPTEPLRALNAHTSRAR